MEEEEEDEEEKSDWKFNVLQYIWGQIDFGREHFEL